MLLPMWMMSQCDERSPSPLPSPPRRGWAWLARRGMVTLRLQSPLTGHFDQNGEEASINLLRFGFKVLLLLMVLFGFGGAAKAEVSAEPLVWNVITNEYTAKPGDISAHLFFLATNVSPEVVTIDGVKTSCGCTSAKLPSSPWHLAPKEGGRMEITVDLRGKTGTLFKSVDVLSTNAAK